MAQGKQTDARPAGDAMVSFENVDKVYGEVGEEESVVALKDINLSVGEGQFYSIVGPSGCGKTTMLHLAANIIAPTSGTIRVNGVDVSRQDHERNEVGLVFQYPVALEWRTVRQNILLPVQVMLENGNLKDDIEYYKRRADTLLELVGLEGFGDAYPRELSGGMQQRVTISQALIYEPSVLLMDEPFGSLDAMTKSELNLELLRIWRETEKTVLFITHDLEEAVFLSDRVFVMSPRPGRIIDDIEIDLPRPRRESIKGEQEFVHATSEVSKHFRKSENQAHD